MIFHSFDYIGFFVVIFGYYWLLGRKSPLLLPLLAFGFAYFILDREGHSGGAAVRWSLMGALALVTVLDYTTHLGRRTLQNVLTVSVSYVFYGWVHPWFLTMLVASTVLDYFVALGMESDPKRRGLYIMLSVVGQMGLLGFFKYCNFFADNFEAAARSLGLGEFHTVFRLGFLPAGISFYTFQTLSYTLDVYRGRMRARRNFLDFAAFVTFFPQLVAGPIERAGHMLPQFERPRVWNWDWFFRAFPLILGGYLKKLVVADNAALFADKVFTLQSPSVFLLVAGTLAFTLQVLADFSAYTDIARGSAYLLGFDLMENFRSPYLATSPSDFWRRWHISFSTWMMDYIFTPLQLRFRYWGIGGTGLAILATFLFSGLWHGAAWHFVFWGIFHGALFFGYHLLGLTGKWKPRGIVRTAAAWVIMFSFTVAGWTLFRTPSTRWLWDTLTGGNWGLSGDSLLASLSILALVAFYSLPMVALLILNRRFPHARRAHAVFYGLAILAIMMLAREKVQDFIYFQF